MFFFELFTLIYLLLLSAVILLIAKWLIGRMTYAEVLKYTLYASTLGVLLKLLIPVPYIGQFIGFPFFFSIVTCVVFFANLSAKATRPASRATKKKSK